MNPNAGASPNPGMWDIALTTHVANPNYITLILITRWSCGARVRQPQRLLIGVMIGVRIRVRVCVRKRRKLVRSSTIKI